MLHYKHIKQLMSLGCAAVLLLQPAFSSAQTKVLKAGSMQTASPFRNFRLQQLNKLKAFKPSSTQSSLVKSLPTEVIDVSNTPKYPVPEKPQYTATVINSDCNVLPLSYKTSFPEVALLFPATNMMGKIYPGAVYGFSEIKNLSFNLYTRHTARNPMHLSTTIFKAGNPSSTEVINSFDHGSVLNKWNALLSRTITGSTPGNVQSELILTESRSQLRADLNSFSSVDVAFKLGIPIPDVPVTVNVGENVTVTNTNSVTSNIENQKNSVIIRYNQVFYSSMVTPIAGQPDVFTDAATNPLEKDLLYISSVDYGQVFYIVITSTFSKEELMNAIQSKVSTRTEIGAQVEGLPIEGTVGVGTGNNSQSTTQSVFSGASTSVRVFQQGGEPMPSMGTTIDEVLNNLKNINPRFSAENLGAPIKFTLNYVKDHSLAYINYNLSYATANCGKKIEGKFDVELELDHLEVKNVKDIDNTEDLYGQIFLDAMKANDRSSQTNHVFWTKSETQANENNFRNGTTQVKLRKKLAEGLTLDELKHLEITIGGKLFDDEGVFGSRKFRCTDCSQFNGDEGKRVVKFIEMVTTQNAINRLVLNGEFQLLKFGDDQFVELNFYESNNKEDGWVKARWKVWVKPL